MDEIRAKDLATIEPPRSIQRLLGFITDYSLVLDAPTEDRSMAMGTVGLRAYDLARQIAGKQDVSSGIVQSLKLRHGVFAREIREFALWLRMELEPPEIPLVFSRRSSKQRTGSRKTYVTPGADIEELIIEETIAGPQRTKRTLRKTLTGHPTEIDLSLNDQREGSFGLEGDSPVKRGQSRRTAVLFGAGGIGFAATIAAEQLALGRSVAPASGAYGQFHPSLIPSAIGQGFPPPIVSAESWPIEMGAGPMAHPLASSLRPGFARPYQPLNDPRIPSRDVLPLLPRSPGAARPAAAMGSLAMDGRLAQTAFGAPAVIAGSMGLADDAAGIGFGGNALSEDASWAAPGLVGSLETDPPPMNPLLGQMTLVAPPIRVASPDLANKGAAMAFDWKTLSKGASQLTPDHLEALKEVLPPGSQALYPALPLADLGPSAVNVPLSPESIKVLLDKGYGQSAPAWAESVASRAWSTPAALPLVANLLPDRIPTLSQARSAGADFHGPSRGLADQRLPAAKKGSILDFLGVPTHFAPSLNQPHDMPERRVAAHDHRSSPAVVVRPNVFTGVQRKAFPHFHSVVASPHAGAWSKAPKEHATSLGAPIPRVTATTPVVMPHSHHMGAPHPDIRHPSVGAGAPVRAVPSHPGIPAHSEQKKTKNGTHRPQATAHEKHAAPHLPFPHAAALPLTKVAHPPLPNHAHEAHTGHDGLHKVDDPKLLPPQFGHLHTMSPPEHHFLQPEAPAPHTTITAVVKTGMPLARPRDDHNQHGHLAVQASGGQSPAAAEQPTDHKPGGGAAPGSGGSDAEVNLLANEVWSLLKRRLAFEAQRAGNG